MLYVITNRKLVKKGNIIDVVEEALKGGADAIILREKDLSFEALLPIAKEIKKVTDKAKKPLIINSNLQVAKVVESEGYHSGFTAFLEEKPVFKGEVGVSIHSLEEAIAGEKHNCHYLLAGHIFPTDCKRGLDPRGIDFIKSIRRAVELPVIAIGGITVENAPQVMDAGANGIAVMSSVMEAEDPAAVIHQLKRVISGSLSNIPKDKLSVQ